VKRTQQQNKAIHKYLAMLSEALNDAGFSVMKVMRHDAEIPWSPENAKELLWRPIQEALLDKDSTTELDSDQVSKIYDVINRHLAEKTGVHVPFPDRFGPIENQKEEK